MTLFELVIAAGLTLIGAGIGALLMSRYLMREIYQWRSWDAEATRLIAQYQVALDLEHDEAVRAFQGHPTGAQPDYDEAAADLEDLKRPPAAAADARLLH